MKGQSNINECQGYCVTKETMPFGRNFNISNDFKPISSDRPPLADVTNIGSSENPVNTTQTPTKGREAPTQISEGDEEILSLLSYLKSISTALEGQQPGACPIVPEKFRLEIEQRWAQGRITNAVAHYYLHRMTCGDSLRAPGQNGQPSLLSAILHEDVHTLAKGSGWQPQRVIGKGAYGSVILWEKRRKDGPPLRIASKDCLCSSFFKDYCAEGHLTRRLNDQGCKNVINVVEWAYIKKPAYKSIDGVVRYTEPKNRICYEFAEHSDLLRLERWYQSQGLIFPEAFIWYILYSVANALCYCRHGTNVLAPKVRLLERFYDSVSLSFAKGFEFHHSYGHC